MVLFHCLLELQMPYVSGLKGRRSALASIKAKLKSHNVSMLDLSGEYVKEAAIAFAFLSPDEKEGVRYLEKIEKRLQPFLCEYRYDLSYEVL